MTIETLMYCVENIQYIMNGKKLHQCNTAIKFKNEWTCHSRPVSMEKGSS